MASVWFVWCRHCNKSTTVCKKPTKIDSKRVPCSLCSKDIDATNGIHRQLTKAQVMKQVDLLEVS